MIMKYGVLWQPGKNVTHFIEYWKSCIRLVEPDAIYLEHPVHSTLFLLMANMNEENKLMESIREICDRYTPFYIKFSGWHVFYNDAATGGDTLVLKIKPDQFLLEIQNIIVTKLSIHRHGDIYYGTNWQGEYLQSMKLWGFPFVGSHWVPHISIASVRNGGKTIINSAIVSKNIPCADLFDSLSLYKIAGEEHIRIFTKRIGDC